MDKKRNVDDILSEIKQRKSRERGQDISPPRRPATSGARIPGQSPLPGYAERKRPEPQPEQPKPASQAEPQVESAVAERASHRTDKPGEFDFVLDEKALEQKWEKETQAKPQPEPEKQEAQQESRGPLDYEGYVRPLTDRAKIRNRYEKLASRPRQQTLGIKPEEAKNIEATLEHARVLPKPLQGTLTHGTGREIRLEDIRKIDFEALSDGMGGGFYEDDESIDDLPAASVKDFGEYNSIDDRRDVSRDIAKTKLWLFIRTAATALLTAILFYYTLCGAYPALPMPPVLFPEGDTLRNYLIFMTSVTGLVAIVGSATVGGGIANLFKMRANSDTLASFAILASLGQGIAAISNADDFAPERLSLYCCVAAIAMLFNAIAKLSMIGRIQMNFRVISTSAQKSALLAIDSDQICHSLIREASRRRPTITYGARAGFFNDFLALSFSDKYDVGVNRSVAPVCLLGALMVAFSTFFLTESLYGAVSAFTAILCVCATFSTSFIETIPLYKLAVKLTPMGGMVSGNKAVEDFCDTRAVILNEKDLFPRGHVSLQGVKAFSRNRIDEAILDAASVICALNGTLSPLFLDMIGGNKKLLRKVDNIVFENGMGVSAWVDQRRVLIGNRLLMQNHGIELPRDKYEQGLMPNVQGDALYLSNSGEVSARFLVSYIIDEELAIQLDALATRRKQLFVYATDANITPHKIWELYGYPEDLIQVLPTEMHAIYRELSAPRDNAVAEIVYNGKAPAMIASIIACINARASILSATVVQMVQIVLGYGFVAFMAFMGYIGALNIFQLCFYQLFWFAMIFIIQQTRQP